MAGVPSFFYSKDPIPTRIIPVNLKGNDGRLCWNSIVPSPYNPRKRQANSLAPYNDNDEGLVDCMDLEDNYEILPTKSGKFLTSFYIPSALLSVIVGPKGKKLKELQDNTQTLIKIPRPNETGLVKVTGFNERSVASARNQITIIALGKREKMNPTHFISIPILSDTIKINFLKFKNEILNGPPTRGISEDIFQCPEKFHLTIVTLCLLDESEIEQAKKSLTTFYNEIVRSFFQENKKFNIHLQGIEIMNDDPSEVDVLYGKVALTNTEDNQNFQLIANEISNLFYRLGWVRKSYDNVKLHVTLMNSLFRKSEDKEVQHHNKRQTFDATQLMEKYNNYNFGTAIFSSIDLSIRYTTGKNGYYDSVISIPIFKK